jgi:tetratricopeptide (TPR) repeat protein
MDVPNLAATSRARFWLIGLGLVCAVLLVYGEALGREFDFVNADDGDYVAANQHVLAGLSIDGVQWAFTTFHAHNWHPLTWLSLQLDSQLFGTSAPVYHRTNVVLHAVNTLLLFWLLQRLTGAMWCSALVAALFGLHPTHVESVAWISERKDVLSALFWLLTMAAYAWYAERPSMGRYVLVVLAFVLGLMAKPMLVTLPTVLLLLDYWPLRRWPAEQPHATRYAPASWHWLVVEKLPLFVLAAASIVLTLAAQTRLVRTLEQMSLSARVGNALVSWVQYIVMTLWPVNLAMDYPHPGNALPTWQPVVAAVFLIGASVALLWGGRTRRYLAVGWLWYLGTLVPVIGLVQAGGQAMADRYNYIPSIGLFIILAWGLADWCAQTSTRVRWAAGLCGAAVALCALLTPLQVHHWRDSEALWRHALAATKESSAAHNQLAMALADKGKPGEALEHFERGLQLGPYARTYGYMGRVLLELDNLEEAAKNLQRAVSLEPDWASAHLWLARTRKRQGRPQDAVPEFNAALALNEHLNEARLELVDALAELGDFDKSREQLEILMRADPQSASLHQELGRLYKRQGKLAEAVACYDRALALEPGFHEAWNNKGVALEGLDQFAAAAEAYRHAVDLQPEQVVYRLNFAHALWENRERASAASQFSVAFRLNSEWPKALLTEAWSLATHPDARHRNGRQALRTARITCEASDYQMPQGLDVLAAAHAELGEYKEAAALQRKALSLLPSGIAPGVKTALEERLALYEKGQPYREKAASGTAP